MQLLDILQQQHLLLLLLHLPLDQPKLLRKSLGGGYHFKRVAVGAGQERFRDAPNKNEHSHIGDSFGYLMLGGGEYNRMTRTLSHGAKAPGIVVAKTDFEVL